VRRSATSEIFWIALEGSEMTATLHFDSPESIITWIETLTNSAITLMSEIVAERNSAENPNIVD